MENLFKVTETLEQEKPEKYLPSTIHVIWAGGSKGVPFEGMTNLAKWAYTNPGFKITLWVDDKVVPTGTKLTDLQEQCNKQFRQAYSKLVVDEESEVNITSIFQVKSIREEGICANENDPVDYAIDRLDPNYGLSSDLLRYRILHKYGGVYIDLTDVTPGEEKKINFLTKIPYANFNKVNDHHKLYVDHLSQAQNPSEMELSNFKLQTYSFSQQQEEHNEGFLAQSRVGNDSFICTKGNPLMLKLAQETERNLQCRTLNEKVMMTYGGFNVKDITLDLSGPNVVKKLIHNSDTGTLTENTKLTIPGYYKKMSTTQACYILPLKNSTYQAVKPPANMRNTRYWNNVGIDLSRTASIEEGVNKIVALANYEIQNMGVLRLEDHLNTLTQAAIKLDVPPEKIIELHKLLIQKITELPLQKVEVAQQISNNPLVTEFYKETGLLKKTCLGLGKDSLSTLLKIWEQSTSFGLFMGTEDYKPEKLKVLQTSAIEETLKPLEIIDVFQRLARGVNFISHIKQNAPVAYPGYHWLLTENKLFQKQFLTDVVSKYFDILDAYSEAFVKNGVNPQEINQIGRNLVQSNPLPQKLLQIIEKYTDKNDINLALRTAASKGNLEDVKYLIKYANIDEQGGTSKKTALHWAMQNKHTEVAEFLITYGANQELKDKDGLTPQQLVTSLENK